LYYTTASPNCQAKYLYNPTAQMVIDTQFVSVWGQLRTRKLHIMYSTPPQNPASML